MALARLAVQGGPLGDWRLQSPGSLRWAQGGAVVSPLLFANGRGASIGGSGRYLPSSQSGQVALDVHALPLDLHAVAAKASLQGLLNARLQARCQGVCQASGQWQFAQTRLRWQGGEGAPEELLLQRFDGRVAWLPNALSLQADLALPAGFGSASVALHSPVTLALPWRWNGAAPLLGTVDAQWGPQLFAALPVGGLRMRKEGQGHLQLQVKGSWDAPQWSGSGQVQGAGFYVPQAGLNVQDLGFLLQGDGRQLRVSQISARSGQGQVQGQGTLDLAGPSPKHFAFRFTGQNFSALNLPEVQAAVAPNLQVTGRSPGRTGEGQYSHQSPAHSRECLWRAASVQRCGVCQSCQKKRGAGPECRRQDSLGQRRKGPHRGLERQSGGRSGGTHAQRSGG
jgi:translocation and assembly module TamB